MAEALNALASLYKKEVDKGIAIHSPKAEEYKGLREKAIMFDEKITFDSTKNVVYKNLGELIAKIFPEVGRINNSLYLNIYEPIKASISTSSRDTIEAMYELRKSTGLLQYYTKLSNQSGEEYFNGILNKIYENIEEALSRGVNTPFEYIIGIHPILDLKTQEERFKHFQKMAKDSAVLNISNDPFPEILASIEMYNALVEAYNIKKSKESPSPINQTIVAAETLGETSAAQINQPKEGPKTEINVPSSAITTTAASSLPTEPESTVVATPTAINLPVETPPVETTPVKAEAVSQVNQPEIIVGEKEVAQIQAEKARQEKVSSAITETVKQFSVSEEKKTEISKILGEFAAKQKGSAEAPPATALERELQRLGEIRQNFQKLFPPTTTTISSTGTTINAPATTKIATTELINSVQGGPSTVAESTTINNTSTATTSSPLQLNEAQQSIVNQFRQKFNIMTPEEKKKQEEVRRTIEQSIKVEGGPPILKTVKEPESTVERGTVQFDQKIPATSVQTTSIANNQNIQNTPQEVKVAEVTSTPQPVTGGMQITAPPSETVASGGQPPINIDLSELSKRLRNLEELLSAPLTVKIA